MAARSGRGMGDACGGYSRDGNRGGAISVAPRQTVARGERCSLAAALVLAAMFTQQQGRARADLLAIERASPFSCALHATGCQLRLSLRL